MNILLSEFLRNPVTTGSIWPSSSSLAERLLGNFNWETARNVIELGAGTGAVTKHILPRLHHEAKFLAVEMNERLAKDFHEKFPAVKLCADNAGNLHNIMISAKFQRADIIVSSLPWAGMSRTTQDNVLAAVFEALNDGGAFSTFCYIQGMFLTASHRFRRKIFDRFPDTVKTDIAWRNLPPAYCYYCEKKT